MYLYHFLLCSVFLIAKQSEQLITIVDLFNSSSVSLDTVVCYILKYNFLKLHRNNTTHFSCDAYGFPQLTSVEIIVKTIAYFVARSF